MRSIDESMKLGANHPMGPLELADFIGLDTCLAIMNVLHEGWRTRNIALARCSRNMSRLDGWAGKPGVVSTITAARFPFPHGNHLAHKRGESAPPAALHTLAETVRDQSAQRLR